MKSLISVLVLVVCMSSAPNLSHAQDQFVPPGLPDAFAGMTCIAYCSTGDSLTQTHMLSVLSAAGIERGSAASAVVGFWVKDEDVDVALRVVMSDRELLNYISFTEIAKPRLPLGLRTAAVPARAEVTIKVGVVVSAIGKHMPEGLPSEVREALSELESTQLVDAKDYIVQVSYSVRYPLIRTDKRCRAFEVIVHIGQHNGEKHTLRGQVLEGHKVRWLGRVPGGI